MYMYMLLLLLLSRFSHVSVWSHRWQPTRLPRSGDSPGKNTGVGCHFLLQCMNVKSDCEVAQSCPTLCDPIHGSPPGSLVPGILQARTLEWVAIAFFVTKYDLLTRLCMQNYFQTWQHLQVFIGCQFARGTLLTTLDSACHFFFFLDKITF